jgi:CRP/FNR family transcriptional regulator, nitrogen fixation regulation protein
MWDDARLATGQSRHHAAREQPRKSGLDSIAVIARRNRGEEIHSWEGADQYWYRVISGGAKFFIVLPGGRRQILDLLLPNDLFGCLPQLGHYCALEAAVNDTVVACYPRKSAEILAESDPEIGRQVQKMVLDTIARSQELILIMGRTTAREKVGAFLLRMAERTSMPPADRLMLLTSRYDIADYLALSVETVSRSLADLQRRNFIALAGPRRVSIVNRPGLAEQDHTGNPVKAG